MINDQVLGEGVGEGAHDRIALELPSGPGLQLNVYTAAADTPTADNLKLLASWAADSKDLCTEAF